MFDGHRAILEWKYKELTAFSPILTQLFMTGKHTGNTKNDPSYQISSSQTSTYRPFLSEYVSLLQHRYILSIIIVIIIFFFCAKWTVRQFACCFDRYFD
jgi:ABC-type transport system involved in cytochrome bd biosynthesis fused ATPase/permease subunit